MSPSHLIPKQNERNGKQRQPQKPDRPKDDHLPFSVLQEREEEEEEAEEQRRIEAELAEKLEGAFDDLDLDEVIY